VASFGFRGEALSSLCELAGAFTVTTRTAAQSTGVRLTYNRAGVLISQETAPRAVGTTVSVAQLFSPLPVRQGEFRRNIKKQYNRCAAIITLAVLCVRPKEGDDHVMVTYLTLVYMPMSDYGICILTGCCGFCRAMRSSVLECASQSPTQQAAAKHRTASLAHRYCGD
jgi:hypothetical protein